MHDSKRCFFLASIFQSTDVSWKNFGGVMRIQMIYILTANGVVLGDPFEKVQKE